MVGPISPKDVTGVRFPPPLQLLKYLRHDETMNTIKIIVSIFVLLISGYALISRSGRAPSPPRETITIESASASASPTSTHPPLRKSRTVPSITLTPTYTPTTPPIPSASPRYLPLSTGIQDSIAPAITFSGPGQEPLNPQTGHVCYGITALDSVTPKENIVYRYAMDADSLTSWLTWEIISKGICFNNLSEGNHVFSLEAKDGAGNIGKSSLSIIVPAVKPVN